MLTSLAKISWSKEPVDPTRPVSNSRKLEDQNAYYGAGDYSNNAYFQYDLSQFSVKFDKCQYVKMYDDELAQDEDNDSPLALKHFVLYKLCPSEDCPNNCVNDEETVPYGKYTMPLADYLEYTVQQQVTILENMCDGCNDCQQQQDNNNDNEDNNNQQQQNCYCPDVCNEYINMENYGYVDASEFIECQRFEQNDQNGNNAELYIGPRCNSYGKIEIGLFSDENCWEPVDDVDVEDMLGSQLSYLLLQHSHSTSTDDMCLTCKETEENNNQEDANDTDDVNEMCENLYNLAAKCESKTGINNGFIQTARQDGDYENQVENEFMACTFIDSLIWNSYTQTGEINVGEPQDEIIRYVTKKQAISLSLLSVTIAGILGAMYYLNKKIYDVEQAHPLVIRGEPSMT